MAYIDYYKILGINKNATQQEIRKAYRQKAKKYHPDLNKEDPHAQEHFQAINEANEVLSDPEKRKKYDEYGENWKHAEEYESQRRQQEAKANYGGYNFENFRGEGFSDFFEELFGNRFGRNRQYQAARGNDYESTLTLPLRDILTTHKQIITVNNKKIRITIPAGIANGQKIRLKGHGGTSADGNNGDLYITFNIEPDPQFTRVGNDLYTTATIDIYTALLGGEAIIPTPTGSVRLHIKAGAQTDSKLRLREKGMPEYKNPEKHGDLIVTLKIELPTLNERQKELLQQMRDG